MSLRKKKFNKNKDVWSYFKPHQIRNKTVSIRSISFHDFFSNLFSFFLFGEKLKIKV